MRATVRKLQRKLRSSDSIERCGLVLKGNRVIEVENMHFDPVRGFKISAEKLLEHEADLRGTWHTHPGQAATLSNEDYRGFLNWPHLTHFIIGTDGVRAYNVTDGFVRELALASD